MPIIHYTDAESGEGYPGVNRAILVDARNGALSLYIGHLTIVPGGRISTHTHPDTEEAGGPPLPNSRPASQVEGG